MKALVRDENSQPVAVGPGGSAGWREVPRTLSEGNGQGALCLLRVC